MLPKYHIVLGFLFSLILFLIFPSISILGASVIFFSSFLIDVDAYLNYIFTKKSFNLINAIKYYSEKRKKGIKLSRGQKLKAPIKIRFLHGIEILAVLFILGIFTNKLFLFIFIGFAFHLFLDIAEQIYYGFRISKISLVYDFIKKQHSSSFFCFLNIL